MSSEPERKRTTNAENSYSSTLALEHLADPSLPSRRTRQPTHAMLPPVHLRLLMHLLALLRDYEMKRRHFQRRIVQLLRRPSNHREYRVVSLLTKIPALQSIIVRAAQQFTYEQNNLGRVLSVWLTLLVDTLDLL